MQRFKSILALGFCILLFISTNVLGNEVYIYMLEGNQLYLVQQGQSDTAARQPLRIMELIPENSIVEIGESTTAYMTCPGCEVVKLTKAESPFTVDMGIFKKKISKSNLIVSHFTAALKEFIYPDSKTGKRVYMNVRGSENAEIQNTCDSLFPQDYEDIMILGDHVAFKWGIDGNTFGFQLRNSSNDQLIINIETENTFLHIPFTKLKPGFVYNWTVLEKTTNTVCRASFSILSEQDTREIKNNLTEIALLLPDNTNRETKIRLQSSYLLSEGFILNAFGLLEANGF